jgi:hypothetical protein
MKKQFNTKKVLLSSLFLTFLFTVPALFWYFSHRPEIEIGISDISRYSIVSLIKGDPCIRKGQRGNSFFDEYGCCLGSKEHCVGFVENGVEYCWTDGSFICR